MSLRDTHGCEKCRKKDKAYLQPIGKSKYNEYLGGKAKETVTEFECTECGARWEEIIERGAGGPGNFWNPISK
jgi:predicted RNA-binding Zn-ribbon protein involved in translation (DUF1610 family)